MISVTIMAECDACDANADLDETVLDNALHRLEELGWRVRWSGSETHVHCPACKEVAEAIAKGRDA